MRSFIFSVVAATIFSAVRAADAFAQTRTAAMFVLQENVCGGYDDEHEQARRFRNALSGLPQDGSVAIGVIEYHSGVETAVNLTQLTPQSFSFISDRIPQGYKWGPGHKNLAAAISYAANVLSGANVAGKVMFVVTDGAPDSKTAALAQAMAAQQQGILIYPIIFSGKSYSPAGQCADALTYADRVFINSIASFPPINPLQDYADLILPVVAQTPFETILPLIADGNAPTSTSRTTFLLINPAPVDVRGTIELFKGNGDALSVPIGGILQSMLSFTIPASGMREIRTDGTSGVLISGWARVRANGRIGVTAVINRFDLMGGLVSQTGIAALSSGGRELSLVAHLQPTSKTGIILVNPYDQSADVLLSVVEKNGLRILATQGVTVPKLNQMLHALDELFPTLAPFDGGTLVLSSNRPLLAVGFLQSGAHTITIPALVSR